VAEERLPELRLRELLDELASEARTPASGSAAALVAAIAAGLVAKAARLSRPGWAEAGGAIAQAETLRARALLLAESDAVAYEDALATLRGIDLLPPGDRDAVIADALSRAADIPLQISQTACDISLLAAEVAEGGNLELAADAAVAALLAEAVSRSAGHLVSVNLASVPEDERAVRGDKLATTAATATKRALAGAH
jgi:methenyltetrahydrofolate cyclohydrolase